MATLQIKPLPTRAKNISCPPLMEQVNLKHPFSLSVFGSTGSGKTVAVLNLLTNPNMYGGYFDEVYLFSVTGKSDDSCDALDLKPSNIITDSMISKLDSLMKKQQKAVESKGIDKAKKVCILFEDLTANKKLMESDSFLKSFVQNRHLSISTIACCHKYHALNRTARLNSNHAWVFPATDSEVNRICDEAQPPTLKKAEFIQLINYCFESTPDNTHPFLWMNVKEPYSTRFRKSLEELIEI
jgi:hypothetical protein